MPQIIVDLAISADDYLAHYQGVARDVLALDTSGRKVRFPSHILRPFVTHAGIYGRFSIRFDQDNRFVDIRPVARPSA